MTLHRRTLVASFNSAIEGFMHVVHTQRNMRMHLLAAVVVIIALLFLVGEGITATEVLVVLSSISLVFITEMLNTAIEVMMDLVKSSHHPKAKVVKDVSAGAVLVAAVNALGVAYLLLARRMSTDAKLVDRLWESPWHVTALALGLIVIISIVTKRILGRGQPLRGGMPSVHSALAFGTWALIVILVAEHLETYNVALIGALLFIMAALVAESRIRDAIHTRREVALGALLGVTIVVLAFQLYRRFG